MQVHFDRDYAGRPVLKFPVLQGEETEDLAKFIQAHRDSSLILVGAGYYSVRGYTADVGLNCEWYEIRQKFAAPSPTSPIKLPTRRGAWNLVRGFVIAILFAVAADLLNPSIRGDLVIPIIRGSIALVALVLAGLVIQSLSKELRP